MADLTVYEKRTCTTCRRLAALLTEHGIDFDRVEYMVEGIDEPTLRRLLDKAGLGPADVLREREPLYRELSLPGDRDDDELIALLVEHPDLLQRPIVERGERAVLARPVERVAELLDRGHSISPQSSST